MVGRTIRMPSWSLQTRFLQDGRRWITHLGRALRDCSQRGDRTQQSAVRLRGR